MDEVGAHEPLAVYRSGPEEGLPLLLLHAFPLDSSMWERLVARLPDVPVVSVDGPGFGDSPAYELVAAAVGRDATPSLETYADAVVATLLRQKIEHAVVVGLSMGGYVALALADRYPALVAGIGLLDTKAAPDAEEAKANRLRVAEAAEGEAGSGAVAQMVPTLLGETSRAQNPELVAEIERVLASAPPPGIAWAQRAMAARPDRLAVLERLDVPSLVLRGSEDALMPQDLAEAMAHVLKDCELVQVPAAGHLSALENPDAVADALRRLWKRAQQ
jgi:pimeloyl-ACP methyl ester carboxylesterase